jgi:hypothetical protein
MRTSFTHPVSRCGTGRGKNTSMATTGDPELAGYESVGPKDYLDRFLDEYQLTEHGVRAKIHIRTPSPSTSDRASEREYLVHESLLRSHGEFPCAGDAQALNFCAAIAEEMVRSYGIPYREAVARINRQWSDPGPSGRTPRIWMVGLDLAYHETPQFWASDIYYGHDSHWWTPDARPRPLPPP